MDNMHIVYCSVNMLKLPVYENKETLHKCLKISLDNCTGFGVA